MNSEMREPRAVALVSLRACSLPSSAMIVYVTQMKREGNDRARTSGSSEPPTSLLPRIVPRPVFLLHDSTSRRQLSSGIHATHSYNFTDHPLVLLCVCTCVSVCVCACACLSVRVLPFLCAPVPPSPRLTR